MRVGVQSEFPWLCIYFAEESTGKRIWNQMEADQTIRLDFVQREFVHCVATAILSEINYPAYCALSDDQKEVFASKVALHLVTRCTERREKINNAVVRIIRLPEPSQAESALRCACLQNELSHIRQRKTWTPLE